MADHVLVAYDGSPQSEDALEYVLEEHLNTAITVLTVIDPVAAGYSPNMRLPHAAEEWYESAKADAENLLVEAEALADQRGVDVDTAVGVGRPANAIVEYAADKDVGHVVVGSHGRTGVSRILLGSVAESVMRKSPVPVTVVRYENDDPGSQSNGDADLAVEADEDVAFDHDADPGGSGLENDPDGGDDPEGGPASDGERG